MKILKRQGGLSLSTGFLKKAGKSLKRFLKSRQPKLGSQTERKGQIAV